MERNLWGMVFEIRYLFWRDVAQIEKTDGIAIAF